MKVIEIQVENYKSFLKPTTIAFTSGFNIIVGKNNCGKTALTEILSLDFENHPHRSPTTLPNAESIIRDNSSKVTLTVEVTQQELLNIIQKAPNNSFLISNNPNIKDELQVPEIINSLSLDLTRTSFTFRDEEITSPFYLPIGKFQSEYAFEFVYDESITKFEIRSPRHKYNPERDLALMVAKHTVSNIFYFRAERYKVGQHILGQNRKLAPDTANLPEVLSNLKLTNTENFQIIIDHLNVIFPDVADIPIETIEQRNPETGSQETLVKLYFSPSTVESRRTNLDISLQDSGTGIGQVLGILYEVVNSSPKTIIIDEPQSFLHPGAIRTFFSILRKNYSHHQYIITTHSPAVISSVNPTSIIQLTKKDLKTTATNLPPNSTDSMKSILGEVGASLSDVFGADSILWVEGPTEVACFQEIIEKVCKNGLLGTGLQAVIDTGKFESKKKDPELVRKIYDRLSKSTALIPPAVGFLFDRESKSPEVIEELERREDTTFIPRRMYENYLIIPEAIEAHFKSFNDDSLNISEEMITDWLEQHKWHGEFIKLPEKENERTEIFWLENVHGANFLDKMYNDLTENKYVYKGYKIPYGLELTRLILEISPDNFDDLAQLLDQILDKSKD